MKFDPATKSLLTDDGRLIKVLSCHLRMSLDQLQVDPSGGHFLCDACSHRVLDTALLTEREVELEVQAQPETCLVVRRYQHNIEIV